MGEKDNEEIHIDLKSVKNTFKKTTTGINNFWKKKNSKIILAWVLIAIVILISTWYRAYPATLPASKDWVRQSIEANVKNQIQAQIRLERPGLPDSTINQMVSDQYNQYYKKNKQQIEAQVDSQSQNFRDQMQDANGQTYLLAIDPYLWYSYAKWYDKNGFWGNEVIDGEEVFTLRNGRNSAKAGIIYPSVPIVALHKVIKIFNPDQDIMTSAFWMPVLLIGLAIIPVFFLGKKLGGLTGGFFAAMIFALNPTILGRTPAGFSDTDAYTFIFPFLIVWLFLESVEGKTTKKTVILSTLAGLSMVLFNLFWAGWWFTFDLIIGLAAIFILYKGVLLFIEKKNSFNVKHWFNDSKKGFIFLVVFILSSFLIFMLLSAAMNRNLGNDVKAFTSAPLQPLDFIIGFKGAASDIGVGADSYPLWPNVFTTVAELNPGSKAQVLAGGGGEWFVYAAILGILFLFFKKVDGKRMPLYGILLAIWMGSTYYAGFVGQRFIALFAPVVAFGIAALIGSLTGTRMTNWAKKIKISHRLIIGIVIVAGIVLIIVPQMIQANLVSKSEIPSYDDTWENALLTIKNSSNPAIISSWWDFGHWFEARSERMVTFDGGDQGKRIHWIGKTLLTSDEDEAIDILKMLNCGQEESYNLLEEKIKDKLEATRTLKEIIRMNREDAKDVLINKGFSDDESEKVLDKSHCSDLYDMYYITSGDMVGKAGVWSHFGSWDFDRAYSYYKIKNMPIKDALNELQTKLGLNEEDAKKRYIELQGITSETAANSWISPWPSYVGSPVGCSEQEEVIMCDYNIGLGSQSGVHTVLWRSVINKTDIDSSFLIIRGIDQNTGSAITQTTTKPSSIVTVKGDNFERTKFDSPGINFDIVLYQDEAENYFTLLTDPLLSESLFTKLFFLEGAGTTHFEKVFDEKDFRGLRIIVWKVNP